MQITKMTQITTTQSASLCIDEAVGMKQPMHVPNSMLVVNLGIDSDGREFVLITGTEEGDRVAYI